MVEQSKDVSRLAWRKSTWSDENDCVEAARCEASVLVRDSRNVLGGVLEVSVPQWRDLLRSLRGA
ncbi:DUF397 domain-containing protein [Actinomadura rubteroloni]|uniref:DUF397 domain-containing protein n=1 Tax=Actinomadura rubteroloni TaxID=1926885 RepID=UPI000CD839C8|nr:DUF397 domain-containing protein [Actinomadura rubteroloni]